MNGRGQSENNSPPPQQNMPGPISQAAAQAQQRRMSLTTLGLSGSPNNSTSPFGSYRGRRGSVSASTDESAIAEDDSPTQNENSGTPSSPFARRTSFAGAKALRDRMGSIGGGGGGNTGQNGTRSPPAPNNNKAPQNGTISSKGRGLSFTQPFAPQLTLTIPPPSPHFRRMSLLTSLSAPGPSGEGFNWSDNFRNRAERTSSIAGPGAMPVGGQSAHGRAKSVATMEPPPAAAMPAPKEQKRPDHFQERILKGDFYMD